MLPGREIPATAVRIFGRRFRLRQVERRRSDGGAFQQLAFADHDDIFVALQAGGDFYPAAVADAGLHRHRLGLVRPRR